MNISTSFSKFEESREELVKSFWNASIAAIVIFFIDLFFPAVRKHLQKAKKKDVVKMIP